MNLLLKRILGASLTLAAFSFLNINTVNAQSCAVAPTCESLGYTKSENDCKGHDVLKCPFDTSLVYCDSASSGSSGNCDNPVVGSFLYSDMSCSTAIEGSNSIIGIIFDVTNNLALALDYSNKTWASEAIDIPGLPNMDKASAQTDMNGQSNTTTIANYCKSNGKSCPAIEYVTSYSTTGTNAGNWYLPSAGELKKIYNNKDKINTSLSNAGKLTLPKEYHWSSTDGSTGSSWYLTMATGSCTNYGKYGISLPVRPIIKFK